MIPKIIKNALENKSIQIYGDGTNIRDWLYVLDHCKAIDKCFHQGIAGESYNIGGNCEKDNNLIVSKICEILDVKRPLEKGSYKDLIKYVKDRPGHDKRYAIDSSKIQLQLGWQAEEIFDSGMLKTIEWYLKDYEF